MSAAALEAHLATGATHVCHCWELVRQDGVTLGFTDHDRPLRFGGIDFMPESGLSARALASTTGLSVNNSEAVGVLQSDAISEPDIEAGRYDGARVTVWLVQWDNTVARQVRFTGTLGEVTRASGGFQAELRGLTDALNQPQGRSYLRSCSAVLGDQRCGFVVSTPGFFAELEVQADSTPQVFRFSDLEGFNDRWFEGGVLEILTGSGTGLCGTIKLDQMDQGNRVITLWQPIPANIVIGDRLRLIAGCDRQAQTCREKFSNLLNFQGFPDIPGDDWLVSVPRSDGSSRGGSLSR